MAPSRLPGWNAERPLNRWAARGAWVGGAAFVLAAFVAALMTAPEVEDFATPEREGFPVGGGEPQFGLPPNPSVTPIDDPPWGADPDSQPDPHANETFADPTAFDRNDATGAGSATTPRTPPDYG